MSDCYVTKGGKVSMDPEKWRVGQIAFHDAPVGVHKLWGVFPPNDAYPLDMFIAHGVAMDTAQKRAMFAAYPAKVLRGFTTQEE